MKLHKPFCQSHKLKEFRNRKCENEATGWYKQIRICTDCYKIVKQKNKQRSYYINSLINHKQECKSCGRGLSNRRKTNTCTDLCIYCLADYKRIGGRTIGMGKLEPDKLKKVYSLHKQDKLSHKWLKQAIKEY